MQLSIALRPQAETNAAAAHGLASPTSGPGPFDSFSALEIIVRSLNAQGPETRQLNPSEPDMNIPRGTAGRIIIAGTSGGLGWT